jgi:hypothetical protein
MINRWEWVNARRAGWTHDGLRSRRHVLVYELFGLRRNGVSVCYGFCFGLLRRTYTRISTRNSPAANADRFNISPLKPHPFAAGVPT